MDQIIKNSFLYLFWGWVKLYIEDSSLWMLDFVDWLDSLCGMIAGFCVFVPLFWPFGYFVYVVFLPIKKKKKCLFGCTKAFKHPLLLLDFSTLVLASILGTLESKMF